LMSHAAFFTKNKLQILSKLPCIMFTFLYRELLAIISVVIS